MHLHASRHSKHWHQYMGINGTLCVNFCWIEFAIWCICEIMHSCSKLYVAWEDSPFDSCSSSELALICLQRMTEPAWNHAINFLFANIDDLNFFGSNSVLSSPNWRGDICRLAGTSNCHIRPCLYSALNHAFSNTGLYMFTLHFWLSFCYCNCWPSLQ